MWTMTTADDVHARPGTGNDEDDPHLWLEDVTGEAALDWVRARSARTTAALEAEPLFETLRAETLAVLDSDERIRYPRRRGQYLYNFWQDEAHPKGLWRRTTFDAYVGGSPDWDVLVDVDALAAEEDENWVWKGASVVRPERDRALLNLSRGGADAVVVREFDLATRTFVSDGFVLPEAKSDVGWIDRDTVYVGTDFASCPDGLPALADSGYPRTVRRWTRGTSLDDAPTVFAGEPGDVAAGAGYDPTPGYERHLFSRAVDFYTELVYDATDHSATGVPGVAGEPVLLDAPSDASVSFHRHWLFVRPRTDWELGDVVHPAGALLCFDYDAFRAGDREATVLFTPDAHRSLDSYSATRDHLVLVTLEDVATHVTRLRLGTWEASTIAGLPELATVSVFDTDPDESDEIFMTATGYATPPALLYGETTEAVRVLAQTPAMYDASDVGTEQFFATSDDGTQVPYFVVRHTDADTPRPTLLYGYGGFENAMTPGYSGVVGRCWIARGGAYVVANIRGGGEYGPTWHTQAIGPGRHRAYEDFAAVARDLVARGITTPAQLGAKGGSNGGLLTGVMYTSYPELFGAIVSQVPLLDMRRYHRLLAGASWMAEYGDPDDPAQWEFISGYSPYQRIRAGVTRPPLLVTTSTRDDRVHPGHARKFIARLDEFGQPGVDYYENIEGGHGGAADNAQAAYAAALSYAFLWRELG